MKLRLELKIISQVYYLCITKVTSSSYLFKRSENYENKSISIVISHFCAIYFS